jgi:hypothetical protein
MRKVRISIDDAAGLQAELVQAAQALKARKVVCPNINALIVGLHAGNAAAAALEKPGLIAPESGVKL